MRIVVYTCVPVESSNGLFRRVRITIDGTKVTSVEHPYPGMEHNSCTHASTLHPHHLGPVKGCDGLVAAETFRAHNPSGDGYPCLRAWNGSQL